MTVTCFYSDHLHCEVDSTRGNEALKACIALMEEYNVLDKRTVYKHGKYRKIPNPWGIGGRVEQDYLCEAILKWGS